MLVVPERGKRESTIQEHARNYLALKWVAQRKSGVPEDKITYQPYRYVPHFINSGWEEMGRKEERRRNREAEERRREAEKERRERKREEREKDNGKRSERRIKRSGGNRGEGES